MDDHKRRPNLDLSLDDLIKANKQERREYRRPSRKSSPPARHSRPRDSHRVSKPERSHGDHRRQVRSGHSRNTHYRLMVTNLHYEVTREDLKSLFETVGPVQRVYMHYDRAGRSHGKAEISFARMDDARVAQERFHNVPLDGIPMQIELQTAPLRAEYNDMVVDG